MSSWNICAKIAQITLKLYFKNMELSAGFPITLRPNIPWHTNFRLSDRAELKVARSKLNQVQQTWKYAQDWRNINVLFMYSCTSVSPSFYSIMQFQEVHFLNRENFERSKHIYNTDRLKVLEDSFWPNKVVYHSCWYCIAASYWYKSNIIMHQILIFLGWCVNFR